MGVDQTPDEVKTAIAETLLALGMRQCPVLIAGRVGVGKSTVAAIVARSFSTWAWFGLDELLTTLMACRTEGSVQRYDAQGYAVHTTEQQLLRRVEQVGCLVLDDVGTRTISEPQAEALRAVLDARIGVARPLICTTNCNTQGLDETVGARNRSRLLGGAVVQIRGPDRRSVRALSEGHSGGISGGENGWYGPTKSEQKTSKKSGGSPPP